MLHHSYLVVDQTFDCMVGTNKEIWKKMECDSFETLVNILSKRFTELEAQHKKEENHLILQKMQKWEEEWVGET